MLALSLCLLIASVWAVDGEDTVKVSWIDSFPRVDEIKAEFELEKNNFAAGNSWIRQQTGTDWVEINRVRPCPASDNIDYFKKSSLPLSNLAKSLGPVWNPSLTDGEALRYHRMAQWSAASYCSQDNLMSWSCGPRCQGDTDNTQVVLYFTSSVTDTVGFVAVYTDTVLMEDQIIIAFRGSVTFQNWVENLKSTKEPSPWPDSHYPEARVHTGFLDSYADIATTIRSVVSVLTKRFPDGRIIVTGHSLGGAVASLCATDLKFHLGWNTNIELVSFHSPRVGNPEFVNFVAFIFGMSDISSYDSSKVMLRRFTNRADPLPHMPPSFLEFLHLREEVWVSLEDRTIVCDPSVNEDINCSNSVQLPDEITDHFYIWDVKFGTDCSY